MHHQASCPQRYKERLRCLPPFQCFQWKNCDKHVGNSYFGALDRQVHSPSIPGCIPDTAKFLLSKHGSCLRKQWQEFWPSIQPSRNGFPLQKKCFSHLILSGTYSSPVMAQFPRTLLQFGSALYACTSLGPHQWMWHGPRQAPFNQL